MSDGPELSALQRQALTATMFVDIVETLVGDFDVIDVLTELSASCVDMLRVAAAGILLADESGYLRVVGASSEQIQLLELFQVQNDQGPCLDCYTAGQTIAATDLRAETAWPKFAEVSVAAGYPSVYAIPLRRNGATFGCLNVFKSSPGPLAPTDVALAQSLADIASIAIVQSHANVQKAASEERFSHALGSRTMIEQAKGMIAEHATVDMHQAFNLLRSNARANHRSLTATANQLVQGAIAITAFDRGPCIDGEECRLTVQPSLDGGQRTVRIGGELDLASRAECVAACVDGDGNSVVVDISAITFMDCSGYGALIAARLVLEERSGSLSVRNPTGQPKYLLGLIAHIESSDEASLNR